MPFAFPDNLPHFVLAAFYFIHGGRRTLKNDHTFSMRFRRIYSVPDLSAELVCESLDNLRPEILELGPNLDFHRPVVNADYYMDGSISEGRSLSTIIDFRAIKKVDEGRNYLVLLQAPSAVYDPKSGHILHRREPCPFTSEFFDDRVNGLQSCGRINA